MKTPLIEFSLVRLLFTVLLFCAGGYLSSCKRDDSKEVRIVHFQPNDKYYLGTIRGIEPGGIFDGTIKRVAVIDGFIVADVDRIFDGDVDGIYLYSLKDQTVNGPIKGERAERYLKMLVAPRSCGIPVIEEN